MLTAAAGVGTIVGKTISLTVHTVITYITLSPDINGGGREYIITSRRNGNAGVFSHGKIIFNALIAALGACIRIRLFGIKVPSFLASAAAKPYDTGVTVRTGIWFRVG